MGTRHAALAAATGATGAFEYESYDEIVPLTVRPRPLDIDSPHPLAIDRPHAPDSCQRADSCQRQRAQMDGGPLLVI
jgi:hypothetical protein